ncbi:E3 ubiquitin-protein ligase SINAT4 [Morella rubra]|uniref:RING-type E3 ubiquitin transferase n=1 Tax=Morella rubra TaxID=262757 RepID=A0A6A1UXH4_9ROSI|nr:E3 ubiquitin-protein ligase SINAT4 [Morella rubra]
MDLDSIECVSSSDLDEDEIHHHHQQHQQQQHHGLHPHPHHHSEFSSSKPRNANNVNNINIVGPTAIAPATSVHELLECPVCTNSMYPPIHQQYAMSTLVCFSSLSSKFNLLGPPFTMKRRIEKIKQPPQYPGCHNGHTLCSTCKTRVHNRCPTCRQELGDIRCLALEKVAESLELPCKYYSLGCPEIFPYYSKLKHEAMCNFRPYNCPYAGSECAVVGDIPFLVAHLRDDHKVDMHTGCTFNHRYVKSNPREVENATWMLTVFHCFGQYFCLHFEAFQLGMAPVYMAFLRFMGDENEARNYSYSLEVGANGRKLIWEGTPRSIRDSHRKVRDSHDGLIIQRNMALFFSGGDRKELKLRVTGRIWKEQQNQDAGVCIPNLCS